MSWHHTPPGLKNGYHFNGTFLQSVVGCQGSRTCKGVHESAVAEPANNQIIRETGGGSIWDRAWLRPYGGAANTWGRDDCNVFLSSMIHNTGTNMLFADAHAKWVHACQTRFVKARPDGSVDANPCFANVCN